ncbi:MAG: DUF1289 domain-containing protein [Gammaproteobacteria bacterium]|nr:DUF1289 domain-containing protein [Gammaproteobacteria bacterium]MDE2350147.1 DUF1289 domain-containing protein [Gammaproteobacteria bacterium]
MLDPAPVSPCINICSLDEYGYCRGCYRTLSEIAGWSRLNGAQQRRLIDVLRLRGAARAKPLSSDQIGG